MLYIDKPSSKTEVSHLKKKPSSIKPPKNFQIFLNSFDFIRIH